LGQNVPPGSPVRAQSKEFFLKPIVSASETKIFAPNALERAKNKTARAPVVKAQRKEAFDALAGFMRDFKRRYFLTPKIYREEDRYAVNLREKVKEGEKEEKTYSTYSTSRLLIILVKRRNGAWRHFWVQRRRYRNRYGLRLCGERTNAIRRLSHNFVGGT
jgi:hypothetical protein